MMQRLVQNPSMAPLLPSIPSCALISETKHSSTLHSARILFTLNARECIGTFVRESHPLEGLAYIFQYFLKIKISCCEGLLLKYKHSDEGICSFL